MIEKFKFIYILIKKYSKKNIFPLILVSTICLTIFYGDLLRDDKKNLETFRIEVDDFKIQHVINENTLDENNQTYCEKSQEWSDINAELFIRRKTANYFIDRKTLLVFTMCRTSWIQNFTFTFHVSI